MTESRKSHPLKQSWQNLTSRLGLNPNTSIVDRTFVFVCLCFLGIGTASLIGNLLMNLSGWLNLAIGACMLTTLGLLVAWRRHPDRSPMTMTLMLIGLLTLAATWFPNGGYRSSGPMYFIAMAILGAVMLSRGRLVQLLILSLAEIGLLCWLEVQHPEWVHVYATPEQALTDILVSTVMIALSMGWCVHVLVTAYENERKRAEAASSAKSVFLSQMSHELRTPLNAVIGFSGQLLDKQDHFERERERLFLRRIRANGEHLLALVNQILDLSRIESGQIELYWQDADARRLVSEVTELMEVLAREKGLRLLLELPEELPLVRTDPARLRQILLNLLGNAVKFTVRGSVICRLSSHPEQLSIEIQDSGPGIPEDQREAIFEPFVRLPGTHEIEGSGMGLPITRFLCDKLGYRLELASAPGGGSLFRVIVPLTPTPREERQVSLIH